MSSPSNNSSILLPSRVLLTLLATITSAGGYMADWNKTHIYNPRWPPHAKFHNGQTMSMGLGLGVLTAYYTWRPATIASSAMDNLFTASLLASMYWATQLSAILYPGTDWVDEEYREEYGTPQKRGAPVFCAIPWIAYGFGAWRMSGGKLAVR